MLRRLQQFLPPGIRIQLTLWYTLVSAVLMLIFGIAFYTSSQQLLASSFDMTLQMRSQHVAEAIAVHDGSRLVVSNMINELPELDGTTAIVDADSDPTTPTASATPIATTTSDTNNQNNGVVGGNTDYVEKSLMVRVLDIQGGIVFATPSFSKLSLPPESLSTPLKGTVWRGTIDVANGQPVRLYSIMLTYQSRIVGVIQVGQSLETLNNNLQHILFGLLIVTPFVLILSAFGSYWLAGRAFKSIHRLAHTAREIGVKDLHQRVPVPEAKDEVQDLSIIFNQMIERLERAFSQQRRFIADASHELRTPVAVIRSMTELAVSQPSDAEDNLLVLREVNAESERLGRLINDLLALARADEGQIQLDREPVRLDLLVSDVVASLESLAAERNITLCSGELQHATILGDAARLIQIIIGLVDNALTYTNKGGTVTLSVNVSHTAASLLVHDSGIGIAQKDIEHIFERFYRADPARSKAVGGSGLGLSIVDWLVRAHNGSIAVESQLGQGTTFTVMLPFAPSVSLLAKVK